MGDTYPPSPSYVSFYCVLLHLKLFFCDFFGEPCPGLASSARRIVTVAFLRKYSYLLTYSRLGRSHMFAIPTNEHSHQQIPD